MAQRSLLDVAPPGLGRKSPAERLLLELSREIHVLLADNQRLAAESRLPGRPQDAADFTARSLASARLSEPTAPSTPRSLSSEPCEWMNDLVASGKESKQQLLEPLRDVNGASQDWPTVVVVEEMKVASEQADPSPPVSPIASAGVLAGAASPSRTSKTGKKAALGISHMPRDIGNSHVFGALERFVRGHFFEMIFTKLIFLSVVMVAVEAQFTGVAVGAQIGFHDYRAVVLGDAERLFSTGEFFFGCLFTAELVLKVLCFRIDFCKDPWNFMDSGIVLAWLLESATSFATIISPLILRLLRMFRLLRLVRLVRSFQHFDSLVIMTTAMQGSMSVLFWSVIVLALVLAMCALFLQTMVVDYLNTDEPAILEVFMYYGTFSRALLSMFEVTLGNWMPPCRVLVENLNEWYFLFFVLHKLVIGLSVLAVINGVFIQETFKVANQDDRLMMLHKERAVRNHRSKMLRLFAHLDDDDDDSLTIKEFQEVVEDPRIKMWLSAMELEVEDVEKVFQLLDKNNTGTLSLDQLVSGAASLKGAARNVDIKFLNQRLEAYHREVQALAAKVP